MEKVKVEILTSDFPKELRGIFAQAEVYDTSCHSGATVLYSDKGYYIKIDEKGNLFRESEMIALFSKMGMGAEFVSYISEEKDYLVTKAIAGEDATHWLDDPKLLCEVLAEAMKQLHETSVNDVPVSPCMDAYKESGEQMNCNTMIHGDFCLPNIMIKDGSFEAFIDVGLAGVGDHHIDLFWALWSLEYNLKTDKYRDYFLDLYGREHVNMDVLALVEKVEL